MDIRLIRPEECEELARITVSAYRHLHGDQPLGPYEKHLRDVEGRRLDSEVYGAFDEDVLVGGVTFVPDDERAMAEFRDPRACGIRMLAVDPSSQGRGAGHALAQHCVQRARELGRSRVILHSAPAMTLAQAMYLRMGFTRAPGLDEYVDERPGDDAPPLHLKAYTKEL